MAIQFFSSEEKLEEIVQESEADSEEEVSPIFQAGVSDLGTFPDWGSFIERYEGAVSKGEFSQQMSAVYAMSDRWKEFMKVSENELQLQDNEGGVYNLGFKEESESERSRYWRKKVEMPSRSLEGVKICLDPGHIGGKCAQLEERWFKIGDGFPVMEGEMTLLVAELVKKDLEALGAEVSMTRRLNEPVGRNKVAHFDAFSRQKAKVRQRDLEYAVELGEKLFYRTAEIRARAELINKEIQPDLVVNLHFNAEAWGDPEDPQLTENNHFHVLINGAYTDSEFYLEDVRHEMLQRVFQKITYEEQALAKAFVKGFVQETQLPPYLYEENSTRAKNIDENPYIWARNLLANRIYMCPVVFLEPYVMNSQVVYDRVQLGHYDGVKLIDGKEMKSIFREYADAVVSSLRSYYEE